MSDNACVIRVRDNGLGIADADRSAIFERFVRAHAHMDGVWGVTGSGLGLAIGGLRPGDGCSIDCESVVGDGSSFYITLPLKIPRHIEPDSPQGNS